MSPRISPQQEAEDQFQVAMKEAQNIGAYNKNPTATDKDRTKEQQK